MNTFLQNPEFRRNLWLEFSPQRLFLMPAVILLVLFVIGKFSADSYKELTEVTLTLSLFGFCGLTIIWGCVQASNALGHEFADGTWDGQRMSSLTPWQMVWGKLLGGSLYAWYGGGILLLIALFAAGVGEGANFIHVLRSVIGLALLALLLQIQSVMRMLLLWQRHPGKAQSRFGIIGSLLLFWIFGGAFLSLGARGLRNSGFWNNDDTSWQTLWYGVEVNGLDFMLFSLFLLTAWAAIGLWQLMRRELLLRNRPWWWLAFPLFWLFWGAGFVRNWDGLIFLFSICAAVTWISVYVLIFFEKKDQAFWIRLIAAWRRRDSALVQHLTPNWLISFALALALSLISLFLILYTSRQGFPPFFRGLLFLVSFVAFVLRDTAWILWLNLAPGARRADGAALVSLAVAYGVLPWLDPRFFLPAFRSLERSHWWRQGFYNLETTTLIAHLAFAAVALWLLYRRFRKTFANR